MQIKLIVVVLIYRNWSTVNSPLRIARSGGSSLLRTKSRFTAKAVHVAVWLPKWLPLLRTLAVTELRTVSWYQSDNFIVLTLDTEAYPLYFLLFYLCKITVCRSSSAKIHHFKRFPECLFSRRFLKLSAQSSSLLHLRFFLPGSLAERSPSPRVPFSTTAAYQCSVLLISSSSLARYFGFP